MFNFLNQNSLVIILVLLSIIVSILIGKQLSYKLSIASVLISIIMIATLLILTSAKPNQTETIDAFNSVLTTSNPFVIFIYSER